MNEQQRLFTPVAPSANRGSNSGGSSGFLGRDGATIGANSRSRDLFISAWGLQRSTYIYQAGLLSRRGRSQKERAMRYKLATHVLLTLLAVSYISVGVANSSEATSVCVWIPYVVAALVITIINLRREYHDRYSNRNR